MVVQISEDIAKTFISSSRWNGLIKEKKKEKSEKVVEAKEEVTEDVISEDIIDTCPLCESHVEHGISDEQLAEHINGIQAVLNEDNE